MTFLHLTTEAASLLKAIEPVERRKQVASAAFHIALARLASQIEAIDILAAKADQPQQETKSA